MKFAKELEQDLVPEWRIKYLNYKAGKKYIKSIARAVNRANGTPKATSRRLPPREVPPFFRSPFSPRRASGDANSQRPEDIDPPASGLRLSGRVARSEPANIPVSSERQSLNSFGVNETNYGSFVRTPPASSALSKTDSRQTFELPGPAIHLPSPAVDASGITPSTNLTRQHSIPIEQTGTRATQADTPGRLYRIFSRGYQPQRAEDVKGAYPLEALDTVRQREKEFFNFLDGELDKVEAFYRQKELQAEARLAVLREQLHEMRNRRIQEVAELRQRKPPKSKRDDGPAGNPSSFNGHLRWTDPIKSRMFKPGANSKALARMPQTPVVGAMAGDAARDYIRRPYEHDVSYRTAKRKLKLALQELYRGMELLKSYALLNRTAFRKLNKKYDKAVNARPPYRYMNEKVNKSWFVNSEVIDGHIKAVEDLYARYFEKGNHKIAATKLRRMNRRPSDKSSIAFWNGLSIGIGAVFAIQGLVYGARLLYDPDPTIRLQTSYLLQLYGGYFLIFLLFSLFCIACYFWTTNKINYPFIFEFDTRHNLDWRQLASFPAFFLLLFGIFIWLNFTRYGDDKLWLYYPVILIFITLLIIFFPAPVLWYRSRKWLAYSHFRLFFAGLYPVEFRDFFLGDMYCSLTYTMSNVELFFCLYANHWENPPMCNSSHSRLLGFFTTLPAIWRVLQCLRRYYDTQNTFPHLVNCGKYIMTILSYVMLSLYRIQNTHSHLALYIAFSVVNGLYTSIWDLFMDFSLLQPDARHPLLRDILGLKRRWIYYAIMVVDPILRFNWIFYAIFTHDTQHNTIASFLIAFTEVIRRGLWTLLRVENEHCTNVAQYKASRDVPLPYDLHNEPLMERASTDEQPARPNRDVSNENAGLTLGQDQRRSDGQQSAYSPALVDEAGLRRRRKQDGSAAKSIRGIMASAHRQDFEKKRRPAIETDQDMKDLSADEVRSEDEDDDDSGSVAEEGQGEYDTESLAQVQRDDDDK